VGEDLFGDGSYLILGLLACYLHGVA